MEGIDSTNFSVPGPWQPTYGKIRLKKFARVGDNFAVFKDKFK